MLTLETIWMTATGEPPANRHKQLVCLLEMNMERAGTWRAPPGLLTESHHMALQMRHFLVWDLLRGVLLQMRPVTVRGREHRHCAAVTTHAGRQAACMQRTCGRKGEARQGQGQGAARVLAQRHPGLAKAGPNPVTIKVKGGLW